MIKKLIPKLLVITNRLLEFLAPEVDKRFSKLEAFFDLLVMATNYKDHTSCFGQEFNLMPGEFITSISELANKWRWQRATVRKFVDTLVEYGQLIHTPQVKCSRMELISLRFKWLPGDHPVNWLSANGFTKDSMPFTLSEQMITSVIRELSEQFAKNVSDMTDENGHILYTSEQRCRVASLYVEAMISAFRHFMVDVYTTSTEKSLLDTFFIICHGNQEEAVRLIYELFKDEGHDINLMIWETYGDTRDAVTRIFSQAFHKLKERLPFNFVPTDSEDKPTETDGAKSCAKRKDHSDCNI